MKGRHRVRGSSQRGSLEQMRSGGGIAALNDGLQDVDIVYATEIVKS
jgi:hypothetical protein